MKLYIYALPRLLVEVKGRLVLSGSFVINTNKEILLLYRKDHKYYETPGGKVQASECASPKHPSLEDLRKTAERELYEELGIQISVSSLEYFDHIEFDLLDGRKAIAHKFITKFISGTPHLQEPELFEKFSWIALDQLDKYPLSPDLKLLLPKLQGLF